VRVVGSVLWTLRRLELELRLSGFRGVERMPGPEGMTLGMLNDNKLKSAEQQRVFRPRRPHVKRGSIVGF
jgi:hypothetical protein